MDGIIAQNADMPMKTMKMTISIMKAKKRSIKILIRTIPMPYDEYTQCPDCGKTAHGKVEIEELFGYRKINDSASIPQSWCHECREIAKDKDKE